MRAREAAADDLRRKREQLLSFLLRHSRIYGFTAAAAVSGRWSIGAGSPVSSLGALNCFPALDGEHKS